MKFRVIWGILLLTFALLAQTKTYLPFSITSSNGRPINNKTVTLTNTGSSTTVATLTYLDQSDGWYYWTGGTSTVPWGDYDVYVSGKLYRQNVSIRNGYTVNQVTRDSLASVLSDSIGSIIQADDTTELKTLTHAEDGFPISLRGLSVSNRLGGGTFIQRLESDFSIDNVVVFDNAQSGKVWVREAFLESPSWINAEWAGAVHDNVTDDTDELKRAIASCGALKANLDMPAGVYVVSDTIFIPRTSFRLQGASISAYNGDKTISTTIRQTESDKPAVVIAGNNSNLIRNVVIENVIFEGPGHGVSTTAGLWIGGGIGDGVYSGDFVKVDNCIFIDWQYGMIVDGVAQSTIEKSQMRDNHCNIYVTGLFTNSCTFYQCTIGEADTLVWIDNGSSSKGINFISCEGGNLSGEGFIFEGTGGPSVNIFGGNWERFSGTGTAWFRIRQSTFLSLTGVTIRSQISTGGVNIPIVDATGGSYVSFRQLQTDVSIDTPRVIFRDGNSRFWSDLPMLTRGQTGEKWNASVFESLESNSAAVANLSKRGRNEFRFNTGTDADRLFIHYEGSGGNAQIYDLINEDQHFSRTGSTHGYVSAIDVLSGIISFSASNNAQDTTQVSVNVGAYAVSQGWYGAIATLEPHASAAKDTTFTLTIDSKDPATGKVVFIVKHPGGPAGSGWTLGYTIRVRRDD